LEEKKSFFLKKRILWRFFSAFVWSEKNVTAEKARIIEIGKESPTAPFVLKQFVGIFSRVPPSFIFESFLPRDLQGGFSLLRFMSPYCCQSFSGNLRIAYLARAFKTLANRSHFSNKRQKNRPSKKYSRRPAFF